MTSTGTPFRRAGETPLPHGGDGLLVQPGAETPDHPNVCRAAIAADDDLEVNFTLDAPTPPLVRVVRTDLLNQAWRLDATARTERSASGSAARPFPKTRSGPRTRPGSHSRTRRHAHAHTGARCR